MSREWKKLKIGDICDVTSSKRIYAKEYKETGMPFYRSKEIIEKFNGNSISTKLFITEEKFDEIKNKFGVPIKGDILLSSVGTLGVPYFVQNEKFYFKDGNLTWFKNFKNSYSEFIFLWLQSPHTKNQINSKSIGSTQKALTIDVLKNFEINLPPLPVQKKIAAILSSLDDKIDNNRNFMKSNYKEMKNIVSDQMKDLPQPPLQKEVDKNSEIIDLIPLTIIKIRNDNLILNIKNRKSHRQYKDEPLTLEELSFLLWASQGVKNVYERDNKSYATLRTVPSGGARHPFETYLLINNVTGLKRGIYRYLAIEHKLLFIRELENQSERIINATLGQKFTGKAAAVFIWSCVAYRGEWRYNIAAHKAMLLDAGHICQNLYLACEGIKAGTCAIAAYDQEKVDKIIDVDGENEFSVYLSPVGKY